MTIRDDRPLSFDGCRAVVTRLQVPATASTATNVYDPLAVLTQVMFFEHADVDLTQVTSLPVSGTPSALRHALSREYGWKCRATRPIFRHEVRFHNRGRRLLR